MNLLVITDLDETLLDKDYQFSAAQPALDALCQAAVPVILNSSKTALECFYWQDRIGLSGPAICENGAALAERVNGQLEYREVHSCAREQILAVLARARGLGIEFEGFNDWDARTIAANTGLPLKQAALAGQRDFSEPLRVADADRAALLNLLNEENLSAQQGGRFLTISGDSDKGRAARMLADTYYPDRQLIVLGDSPNDLSMLNGADIAVVIASERQLGMMVEQAGRVMYTDQAGAKGWNEAILALMEEVKHG